MIIFKCECGQKCAVTGEAARRPFVKLCGECEKLEAVKPLEWNLEALSQPSADPLRGLHDPIQGAFNV
jgi:hypothetical protein